MAFPRHFSTTRGPQLKMGVNRDMLSKTRVVAATLAATEFPCLDDFIFPIIVLDEACQMTEPSAGMSMRS